MSLSLSYQPWPGGTMDRDHILDLVAEVRQHWERQGISFQGVLGTRADGEGWLLMSAPNREALVAVFHEFRIPYLVITEVWRLDQEQLAGCKADWAEAKIA